MNPQLIDICFNFTHDSFRRDEQEVLQRALAAGVSKMLVTGASVEESEQAVKLAAQHPQHLFATSGVHPHLASRWNSEASQRIRDLARATEIKAIGECGLDYNRDFSPRDKQRYAMEAQLEIAVKAELPVFLHERDAHDDFIQLLQRYRPYLNEAVVHCFTGERSQLEAYLELDCHIGITGWICDERRGHHLRELVGLIPSDRLLLETDAPYLVPRDLKPQPKGRRNEPAFLPHICHAVAEARGEPPEALSASTTANAIRFFKLI